jgi:predicted TIM-barrel fold metal-dependent hydrolase
MVESPWGPMHVADAHVHFFSPRFFESLISQKAGLTEEAIERATGWHIPHGAEALARHWSEDLDRHGVDRAVLIASVPGDHESVTAAAAEHPGRFWAYSLVNPLADDAVLRLQGALDSGNLHGICLFPAMHGYGMHGDSALAVLDVVAASRPATVVFVHCGVLTVGVRKKLGLLSPFDMRYSNPIDLHAVALGYPQIRFVVPHFGAGYFREALMLADLCPNVYLDTSSSNKWMKYDGLDLRHTFRRALEVVGPKRLLFGTDSSFFPRGWVAEVFRDQATALYELGTSEHDACAIFGGNLVSLLA